MDRAHRHSRQKETAALLFTQPATEYSSAWIHNRWSGIVTRGWTFPLRALSAGCQSVSLYICLPVCLFSVCPCLPIIPHLAEITEKKREHVHHHHHYSTTNTTSVLYHHRDEPTTERPLIPLLPQTIKSSLDNGQPRVTTSPALRDHPIVEHDRSLHRQLPPLRSPPLRSSASPPSSLRTTRVLKPATITSTKPTCPTPTPPATKLPPNSSGAGGWSYSDYAPTYVS